MSHRAAGIKDSSKTVVSKSDSDRRGGSWGAVDLNRGSLPPSTTVCRPRSSVRALS